MVSARSLSLGSWLASCPYSQGLCPENNPKLRHLFLSPRAKFHMNLHSTEDIIIFPWYPRSQPVAAGRFLDSAFDSTFASSYTRKARPSPHSESLRRRVSVWSLAFGMAQAACPQRPECDPSAASSSLVAPAGSCQRQREYRNSLRDRAFLWLEWAELRHNGV